MLTEQNASELLEAARFKSKRELEVLLAARFEKPGVSSSIRGLPQRSSGPAGAPVPLALDAVVKEPLAQPSVPRAEPAAEPQFRLQAPASAATRPCVEPLGRARYKLQLSAGQELHDKVQQAREPMRHELPDGDLAQIVERALDL